MSQFRLKPAQRRRLRRLLHETSDLSTYRRCLAHLEVDSGRAVADVARSLGVTRQSVHNWIARLDEAGGAEALADRYGGGADALEDDDVEGLVALLGHSPQHFGSPAANWTVPLLRQHLRRATGADVSEPTARRQLRAPWVRLEAAPVCPRSGPRAQRRKNAGSSASCGPCPA